MHARIRPRVTTTTIKVPAELRDRLHGLARRDHTTLAAVVTNLLDAVEERAFWDAVRTAHEAMSAADRAGHVPDATLADDLADDADDALSGEDAW